MAPISSVDPVEEPDTTVKIVAALVPGEKKVGKKCPQGKGFRPFVDQRVDAMIDPLAVVISNL
jgi:hypothetical protein